MITIATDSNLEEIHLYNILFVTSSCVFSLWDSLVKECCVHGNTSDCNFGTNPPSECHTQVIERNIIILNPVFRFHIVSHIDIVEFC